MDEPFIRPEDRPMKITSVEGFGNEAGSSIKIHMSRRQYISDKSINQSELPESISIALKNWLEGNL